MIFSIFRDKSATIQKKTCKNKTMAIEVTDVGIEKQSASASSPSEELSEEGTMEQQQQQQQQPQPPSAAAAVAAPRARAPSRLKGQAASEANAAASVISGRH